ncbi:MAG: phosphodiesterase [Lysobacteraceae bacterium]|nr:MAG: phosphodiesterase [Xanthomonadaceae bacterium]
MHDLGNSASAYYRETFYRAPVPMLLCDGATLRLLDANPCAVAVYGADTDGLDGVDILALYDTGHHVPLRSAVERALQDGEARLDGVVPRHWAGHPLQGPGTCHRIDRDGRPPAVLFVLPGAAQASQAQHRLRDALLQTQADLRNAQEIANLGVWAADIRTGIIETTTPETYRIFRLDKAKQPILIDDLFERIHPDDLARVIETRERALGTRGLRYDSCYRVVDAGREIRYVHSLADVVLDEAGLPVRVVGVSQDITDIQHAHEEIQRLAFFDETTGLPNRLAMCQHVAAAFDTGHPLPVAVLSIELAWFRQINLSLGHLDGDALLRAVAQRLAGLLDEDAHLSRTASSQFTVILHGPGARRAQQVAQTIAGAFNMTFPIEGVAYELDAHIGISEALSAVNEPAQLVRQADVAVLQARRSGRVSMVYTPAQDPFDPQRLALLGEFRDALRKGEIELYFQPKIVMATGKVIGAEALVRWRHPVRGLVAPSEFLPLIEPTELIHSLTAHMLQGSVRQAHAWRQEGLAVPIAVNVSPRNLNGGNLANVLQELLSDWNGTPDWIGLEITESSLMLNPEVSIAELTTLSRLGYKLYIDDFGTGYSSLDHLTRLPVDVIKIDSSFTMAMLSDTRAAAIVKATIDLAHDLGMGVVAEGAATREIWDALIAHGCDEAQGFHVAPPLPSHDFATWMRKGQSHRQ